MAEHAHGAEHFKHFKPATVWKGIRFYSGKFVSFFLPSFLICILLILQFTSFSRVIFFVSLSCFLSSSLLSVLVRHGTLCEKHSSNC